MRRLKPTIICLVETKSDVARSLLFCNKFARSWAWAAIPAQGFSGGIIVLWSRCLGLVTPIAATRMSLNLVITSTKGSWILTVVYNSQIVSSQRLLWFTLAGINRICLPWLIFGDFNAILSTDDFKGGASNSYIFKSRFFSNFVNSNNLMDIGFVGPRFTWCNNQSGFARRWARLDRCLANLDWISKFSSLKNTHLPRACSDHCPLLLTANSFIAPSYSIFRFNNFWFEYNTCHDIIINSFEADNHSSPMQSIQHCLFRAKRDLLSWRRTGHCSIDIEISNIEAEISLMEARELQSMDPWLVVWLRSLRNRHAALIRQISCFWAQRAKMHWLNQGDLNTSFFQRSVKAR